MHLDFLDLVFLNRKPAPPPEPTAMADATRDAKRGDGGAETCPVDHSTREAWLRQARAQQAQDGTSPAVKPIHPGAVAGPTSPATSQTPAKSWGSSLLSFLPFGSAASTTNNASAKLGPPTSTLDTKREVSSIPRAAEPGHAACPANNEQETGADAASGNWIYPSEKMFFDAMKRKGYGATEVDMKSVVPIHNAVNERAWKEIGEWEAPYTGEGKCGGPKLHSFSGLPTKMSPKARLNTILGYQPPFDRHDWVVDRCGIKVEYLIDFYAGRSDAHGRPSFYLDVRPKLNSWEGVRMRALRGLGLV